LIHDADIRFGSKADMEAATLLLNNRRMSHRMGE
jgi:hypothetical protein